MADVLFRKLLNTDKAIAEATDLALLKLAMKATASVKSITPKRKTRLLGSIMYKLANGQSGGYGEQGSPEAGDAITGLPERQTVVVGTNVKYAPYVEFGTRNQASQPYLQVGVESVVNGQTAAAEVKKAFAEAAARNKENIQVNL